MVAKSTAMLLALGVAGTSAFGCIDKQARAEDAPLGASQAITVAPAGKPTFPTLPPDPLPPRAPEPEPPFVVEGGAVCLTDDGAPFVAPRC